MNFILWDPSDCSPSQIRAVDFFFFFFTRLFKKKFTWLRVVTVSTELYCGPNYSNFVTLICSNFYLKKKKKKSNQIELIRLRSIFRMLKLLGESQLS